MTEHLHHRMHPNSERVFLDSVDGMSRRARECYAVLAQSLAPLTDRQVMEALRYTDPNAVRPRLTELVDQLWAVERGSATDHITGKRVRLLQAVPAWKRQELIRAKLDRENASQMELALT